MHFFGSSFRSSFAKTFHNVYIDWDVQWRVDSNSNEDDDDDDDNDDVIENHSEVGRVVAALSRHVRYVMAKVVAAVAAPAQVPRTVNKPIFFAQLNFGEKKNINNASKKLPWNNLPRAFFKGLSEPWGELGEYLDEFFSPLELA